MQLLYFMNDLSNLGLIGLTSGCFDLLHYGHLHYLEQCASLCDYLIVGVDSDNLVKSTKGPARPIIPEEERLQLISSLSMVDRAFIVRELKDLTDISNELKVTKVFKHEGYKKVSFIYGVHDASAELVIVPDVPGLRSTTSIIYKVLSNTYLSKKE